MGRENAKQLLVKYDLEGYTMLKLSKTIFALIFVFLFTACMPYIPHNVIDSREVLTKSPSPDEATVVFVGAKINWAGKFPFALYDGKNIIGAIEHEQCMVTTVSPGKHLFSSFFKKNKLMDGRPRFMFLDSELAGKDLLRACNLSYQTIRWRFPRTLSNPRTKRSL